MSKRIVLKSLWAVATVGVVLSISSCGDKPKDTPVSPPTNLSVTDITETSAKLLWSGTADSYEILLSSQHVTDVPFTSTTNSCLVTNLTENTPYSWKVRAKKGDKYSDWVTGPNFTTVQIPDGVTVQFGNLTWTAANAGAVDYGTLFNLVALKVDQYTLPFIDFGINKSGTTTFPLDEGYWAEYWEKEEHLLSDDKMTYGDWWVDEGTITITSSTGTKISGTAQLTMFNAYQYFIEENENPEMRELKVTFKNVNVITPSGIKSLTIRNNFSKMKDLKRGTIKAAKR